MLDFAFTGVAPAGGDEYTEALTVTLAAVERPGVNAAPSPVFFEVANVTGCDAADPGVGEVRDPKFHDIAYVWDFGDAANATPDNAADLNLPTAWKNINVGYGKRTAHVYSTPGTFAVTVTAYEPSTRRKGSATVNVTIGDPKAVFPTTRTIIFNPNSIDLTSYGYPSASVQTTWGGVTSARNAVAASTAQILIAPGVTLNNTQLCSDTSWANIRIGALDPTGAKPIIQGYTTQNNQFLIRDFNTTKTECVLFGLDLRGDWDSTRQTGINNPPVSISGVSGVATHLIMNHRCKFSGFSSIGGASSINSAVVPYLVESETTITNWQDYGTFGPDTYNAHGAFIACSIHQDVNALSGGAKDLGFYNQHGPLRVAEADSVVIDACSLYSRNGWSPAGGGQAGELEPYVTCAIQPALRLNTDSFVAGFRAVVTRIVCEGGIGLEEQGGAAVDTPGNYLFDKWVQIVESRTQETIEIRHSGVTMRNGLGYFANVPKGQVNGMNRWIYLSNEDGSAANDAGVEVYNCTCIDARSNANVAGTVVFLDNDNVEGGGADDTMLNVVVENNIFEQPNRSPAVVPDAPVDLLTASGVVLRDKGPRFGFLYESGTLATNVVDDGYFTLAYADVRTSLYNVGLVDYGTATNQAYWIANGGTRHTMNMGGSRLYSQRADTFEVTFEASEIRVYNRTGATWASGTAWTLNLDRADALPDFDPQYDVTGVAVPLPRPQAGSAAIDDATTGKRAYDDLLGAERPATGDERGALLTA